MQLVKKAEWKVNRLTY